MDISKLPPAVRESLRERGYSAEAMASMSPREAFDEYCTWHGLIHWGDTLWEQAAALMKMEPTPDRRAAVLPANAEPRKIVVVIEGGIVQSVLAAEGGFSVSVIDYDKNADLDDLVVIPQGDGEKNAYALAEIHEPEVNSARVDELYSAVVEAKPAAEDDDRPRMKG